MCGLACVCGGGGGKKNPRCGINGRGRGDGGRDEERDEREERDEQGMYS